MFSKNFLRILSFISIFTFSSMVFGCDYVDKPKDEGIPLKGKNITNEIMSDLNLQTGVHSKSADLKFYKLNRDSPKYAKVKKKLEKRLEKHLKHLKKKSANDNLATTNNGQANSDFSPELQMEIQ